MVTKAFRYVGLAKNGTTLIIIDPGVTNTKLCEAGWGKCGIKIKNAIDTYLLATTE